MRLWGGMQCGGAVHHDCSCSFPEPPWVPWLHLKGYTSLVSGGLSSQNNWTGGGADGAPFHSLRLEFGFPLFWFPCFYLLFASLDLVLVFEV